MAWLGKVLAATVSAGAMLTGMLANDAARIQRERKAGTPFAPTARKPEFKRSRKVASAKRDALRKDARARYERQLRKERGIGTDPIFHHGSYVDLTRVRKAWQAKSREWDQAHG